jgi:hypothetical protein
MPSLEVSFSRGGHPPVTEREREIRLNGTGGVKLYETPESKRFGRFVKTKPARHEDPHHQYKF